MMRESGYFSEVARVVNKSREQDARRALSKRQRMTRLSFRMEQLEARVFVGRRFGWGQLAVCSSANQPQLLRRLSHHFHIICFYVRL